MTEETGGGSRPFADALRRHLAGPSPQTRDAAYEIGRRAVEQEAPVLEAIGAVAAALVRETAGRPAAEAAATIRAATDFLADYLAPFELLVSGTGHSLHALQKSHLSLEAQAAELARTNGELAAAKAAAEQAAAAKAAFLASMSHEIRTPLGAIIGMAGLLAGSELTGEQGEYLTVLRTSGDHLLSVVNQVLDYSRADAGGLQLELLEFDVAEIVGGTLEMVAPLAEAKGLALRSAFSPSVPERLRSDPARLRQVLLNLLSNAIKFTAEGAIDVRVDAAAGDEGRVLLKVSVEDTGIGIEPAQLDAIFEPFGQADASTGRRFGGTGLGLAISRRIVELFGGRIWARSVPERGSVVTFTMPVHAVVPGERPVVQTAAPATPRAGAATPPAGLAARPAVPGSGLDPALAARHPLAILVADDNAINRRVATALLGRMGYAPDVAENGEDALARIRADHFDLVLLDVHMPRLDGLDVARAIVAERAPGDRPRLVALTADVTEEQRRDCLAAGIDEYLVKPIAVDALIAEIERTPARSRA